MSACNRERTVKIGAELPKLSPKNWVSGFLDHPVYINRTTVIIYQTEQVSYPGFKLYVAYQVMEIVCRPIVGFFLVFILNSAF